MDVNEFPPPDEISDGFYHGLIDTFATALQKGENVDALWGYMRRVPCWQCGSADYINQHCLFISHGKIPPICHCGLKPKEAI